MMLIIHVDHLFDDLFDDKQKRDIGMPCVYHHHIHCHHHKCHHHVDNLFDHLFDDLFDHLFYHNI